MQIFEITADLIFNDHNVNSQLNRIDRTMQNVGRSALNIGNTLSNVGSSLMQFGSMMTSSVTMPIVGAISKSIMAFSDLGEATNVVDVTFGKNASSVKNWSKTLLDSFGIGELQAIQFSGTMGSIFKTLGMGEKDVLNMSQNVVELSGDLASFKNLEPEEAFYKLRSGILGETEPLKEIGILVDETTTKHFAMKHGLKENWTELSQIEKAMWRYKSIMSQTKDAQGDFTNTSDSFANKLRVLQGRISDVGIEIGGQLMPYAQELLGWVEKAVAWFKDLNPAMKKVVIIVGLVAAAIGPLVTILGMMVVGVGAVITAFGLVSGAISAIGTPVLVVVGIIGALGAAFAKSNLTIQDLKNGFSKVVSFLQGIFGPVWEQLKASFKSFDLAPIKEAFLTFLSTCGPLVDILKALGIVVGVTLVAFIAVLIGALNGIIRAFDNVIAIIISLVGIVTNTFTLIVGLITGNSEMVKESLNGLWENVKQLFKNGVQACLDIIDGYVDGVISFFQGLYNTLVGHSIIPDLVNGIIDWFKKIPAKILSVVKSFCDKVVNYFNNLKSNAVKVFNNLKNSAVSIWNSIKSKVVSVASSLYNSVKSKFNSLKSSISNIFSSIKSTASSIWNSIKSKVVSIASSLYNGVKSKVTSLKNRLVSILSTIRGKFSSVWNSIKSTVVNIVSSMVTRVKDLINGISSTISNIGNKISGLINKASNLKIPGFASGVTNYRGGYAWVGENGPELVELPTGSNIIPNHRIGDYAKKLTPISKKTEIVKNAAEQKVNNIYLNQYVAQTANAEKLYSDFVKKLKGIGVVRNG